MAQDDPKGNTPDGFDLDWADELTEKTKELFGAKISIAAMSYIVWRTLQKMEERNERSS